MVNPIAVSVKNNTETDFGGYIHILQYVIIKSLKINTPASAGFKEH